MDAAQVRLTVPAQPAFVGVARLTISGLAARLGFDVDATEDIKLAVAEAVTLMVGQAAPAAEVDLTAAWDAVALTIALDGPRAEAAGDEDEAIAIMVMQEFMDSVELDHGDARLAVRLVKQLPARSG